MFAVKDYEKNDIQNPSNVKRRILDSLREKELVYTDCGCNAGFNKGIVLDPFMGSGSSFIAAKQQNVDVIGTEINPKYVKIAWKRILKYWNPNGLW